MDQLALRRLVLFDRPNVVFILLSGLLAALALSASPSLVPGVGLLAVLLVYSRILIPGANAPFNAVTLWLSISLGQSVPRAGAAFHALSTPGVSFLFLFVFSCGESLIALSTIYLNHKFRTKIVSSWSQNLLFPALWTATSFTTATISPAGRLSTWGPVDGLGAYRWMLPFLGTSGVDWIMAAWAVVLSCIMEAWLIGDDDMDDDRLIIIPTEIAIARQKRSPNRQASVLLGVLLLTLALPSLVLQELPLPVAYPISTPLSVGCVLPRFNHYKNAAPTLDDFIAESQKLTNNAKILLWPEGAVQFASKDEKNQAFDRIRTSITGSYVGVSFEEEFTQPGDQTGETGSKRTGIALISKDSSEPLFVYYKRYLVPIAESFSLTHSEIPPSIYVIELTHPKDVNKTDWAPPPSYTRPIAITTSICLDFAAPFPFSDLESRPSLILGPARTWHTSVGYAMWQQAKRRADEIGSIVLWCDGGRGGVSGLAGKGYDQIIQVGSGSWVQNIEIQYPFNDDRTIFAVFGSFIVASLCVITFLDSIDLQLPFASFIVLLKARMTTQRPQQDLLD